MLTIRPMNTAPQDGRQFLVAFHLSIGSIRLRPARYVPVYLGGRALKGMGGHFLPKNEQLGWVDLADVAALLPDARSQEIQP